MNIKSAIAVIPVIFFISAFVWEGIAVTAPSGELPEIGMFAATNSFPVNSIVEITNMENGKTARVSVVSGLDTPGILAMISKNASEKINISGRTLNKIRIRLVENPTGQFAPAALSIPGGVELPARAASAYTPENEWANDSYPEIIDLPEFFPQKSNMSGTYSQSSPVTAQSPNPAIIPGGSVFKSPEPAIPAALILQPVLDLPAAPLISYEELILSSPAIIASVTQPDELYDYSIPEKFVISGIHEPDEIIYAYPVVIQINESYLIQTFEHAFEEYELSNIETQPPISDIDLIEMHILRDKSVNLTTASSKDIKPNSERVIESAAASRIYEIEKSLFSVPVIKNIKTGDFYLQLGAFGTVELVEKAIKSVNPSYPLRVLDSANTSSPVYRLLVGPLNQGESAALLRQFRSQGYKDAFIRSN